MKIKKIHHQRLQKKKKGLLLVQMERNEEWKVQLYENLLEFFFLLEYLQFHIANWEKIHVHFYSLPYYV